MSEKTLNDYCEFIVDCLHKTAPIEETETGFYSIRTPDIGRGRLNIEAANRVSEETYKKWTVRGTPQAGDLILAREAPVGNIGIVPKNAKVCCGQRTVHIRPDKSKIVPEYLVYLMNGDEIQGKIQGYSQGATVAHLNMEDIRALVLPELPPMPTQRRIADILSAYDDLIENNTRRIRILEGMAQAIYQEWFGKVDKESLPKGWEVAKVGERFSTALGGTPSRAKNEYWQGGTIPWINSSKCNELRIIEPSEYITELGLNNSSTKMLPRRATIIAITGATLGQVSLTEIETCANQSVVGIWDDQNLFTEFIYLTFRDIINEVIQHAGGAAQQHINKEIVNAVEITIPSKETAKQFQEVIKPIFDLLANLVWKNVNLRQTRDLLLPRLVSGEVNIS